MDRINGAGHVNHRFVTEDAATNRPPTEITDDWLNGVQEELLSLIEEQQLEPSNGDLTQVSKAIKMLLQKSSARVTVAGGTADAITAAYTPAIAGLSNGMTLYVRATAANATTTPTFTPASGTIAAKTIVKGNGLALVAGDIAGAGHWLKLQYDLDVDKWTLLNPATGVATVTAESDPGFADSSSKPASTSWIRRSFSAIATAAGFSASFNPNGYIKFPDWLGAWIFQWGQATTSVSADVQVNFPVNFPNSVFRIAMGSICATGLNSPGYNTPTTSGVKLNCWSAAATRSLTQVDYIVIGK